MSDFITSPSHGPGHACLTFSKDGTRVYTGGQDCLVRIWKTNEGAEQEPDTAAEADQAITCVASTSDCWLSGSEDAEVRRYVKHKNELDGLVTSTNGVPVRSVAVDPKGKKVAVTSDDLVVKVVDLDDTMQVTLLRGHMKGVRSATWHPSEALLTTCGSDGKIIVWDITSEEPKVEKTIEGIIPAIADLEAPEFSHDCSAIWHTSGQYFFVATAAHEIVTISRSTWAKSSVFTDKDLFGAVTALALSVNGVYLATASRSKVHIWSTQTKRVIASRPFTAGTAVTQLAFSPRDNLLAWTDTEGSFSRWIKAVPDAFPDPVKPPVTAASLATLPSHLKNHSGAADDGSHGVLGRRDGPDDSYLDVPMADVDEDWTIDDLGNGLRDDPGISRKTYDGMVKEMVSITKAQPPFQPGSTPMENKRRYLAFNMIGVIEVTDQEDHNIVNVEFFDKSSRKGYHFTDHNKYGLGYLGERGAVYACQSEGEEHPAHVLYKPYGGWTKQYEWTYSLKRSGTRVLGIAAGGLPSTSSFREHSDSDLQGYGNVVVATSEGDLTFLSGTGRERRILGLGAEFVSMIASPEWVFVVHRAGSTTIDGSQNLTYSMINFDDFSVRQRDILPLLKGHVLKWIGLTDQGAPAMYDSAGHVHVLTKFRIPHHASWARIMDTNLLERKQGKDESYWPVGITENTFMCLILKGRQKCPGFPRPLMQDLPIQFPFRCNEPREEQIEKELLYVQTALDSLDDELTTDDIVARERAMDKEFIILIQGACKADNIPRAIELAKLLHQLSSFDAAMKIAEFYHLLGLKEKIQILKQDRVEGEDRLIAARNKRRRWLKPEPALREIRTGGVHQSPRFDPLGDTRPPPPIERPGMTRVTVPVIETTRYTSVAPPSANPAAEREPSPAMSSTTPDGKRKRAEVDDLDAEMPSFATPPPPKQKTNPFAKKPAQDNRNPFAKKNDLSKTIQKTESFFEKVEAAEDASRGKRSTAKPSNNKKEGPRQTTLLGMMGAKAPPTKKSTAKSDENGADGVDDESQQTADSLDSQTFDIMMSESTLVESQGIGWDETQTAESEA